MDELELLARGATGLHGDERVVDAGATDAVDHGLEARRALRVSTAGEMIEVVRVREEEDRHRDGRYRPIGVGQAFVVVSAPVAPRSSATLLRWGGDRLRVGPWRGDRDVAYVAPVADSVPMSVDGVKRCCAYLQEQGFDQIVTAALAPSEARPFLDAGFAIRERLHLLTHELVGMPDRVAAPEGVVLRRARRVDRPAVLGVDARSFDAFWRLDDDGVDEAVHATPTARFRVAVARGRVVGYAICGRAGTRGFLQRLAVDPDNRRAGCGRALVLDGLRWMHRRGAERAVVNTQERNTDALRLYQELGFVLQPTGLAVLHTSLV